MPDTQAKPTYPLPYPLTAFRFNVSWGDVVASCSDVTGLVVDRQLIDYRFGDSNSFMPSRIPGLRKPAVVTIKRPIMTNPRELMDWFMSSMKRPYTRTIIISLWEDDPQNPIVTWNVTNAFPVKVEGPQLRAMANELAFESAEFAYDDITMETPPSKSPSP